MEGFWFLTVFMLENCSKKYVEEYRANDIERELGLKRENLIGSGMEIGHKHQGQLLASLIPKPRHTWEIFQSRLPKYLHTVQTGV